jgi:hypothetical protein
MRQGGVRMWPAGTLPPGLAEAGAANPPIAERARYLAGSRVLRYGDDATPGVLRHELAHALDDVGGESRPMRLDDMSAAQRTRAVATLGREVESGRAMSSTRDQTLLDSFEAYGDRRSLDHVVRESQTFDTTAPAGYSRRSVEEFYAEGFNSFHQGAGGASEVQRTAPELYRRLAEESRAAGTLPAYVDPHTLAVTP